MMRRKRRRRWPWAAGTLIFAVVVVVLVMVLTGGGSSTETPATAGSTGTPSRSQLWALLPTRADVPGDWSENVGAEHARRAGPPTSTSVGCTAAYSRLYSAESSARNVANAVFSAPAPAPAPVSTPPASPVPTVPPARRGVPAPAVQHTPVPALPPPPSPVVSRLAASVAAYPVSQARAQYRLLTDTLVSCPVFTTADGASATVVEGDDANSLGDQSDEFRVDYAAGSTAAHHAILWESRSAGMLWRLVYTYSGAYNRDQAKRLIGRAVAEWKAGL